MDVEIRKKAVIKLFIDISLLEGWNSTVKVKPSEEQLFLIKAADEIEFVVMNKSLEELLTS